MSDYEDALADEIEAMVLVNPDLAALLARTCGPDVYEWVRRLTGQPEGWVPPPITAEMKELLHRTNQKYIELKRQQAKEN
jgi:hypothetical protein